MKEKHMKEKMIGKHDTGKEFRRSFLMVTAQLLVLVLLFVTVSFAPQVIFQIQDRLLCDKTELGQRESMDVETLGIQYEKSLSQRMQNFAEGLAAGEKFYVTSESLSLEEELYNFLSSDLGLYQDVILILFDAGWINSNFLYANPEVEVNQWKQYVIYSDDYAKGVNFILWYVELQNVQGTVLKLLVDAETGTFYALKTENSGCGSSWIPFVYIDVVLPIFQFFSSYYEVTYDTEPIYVQWKVNNNEMRGYISSPYVDSIWEITEETSILEENNISLEENILRIQLPYGKALLELCFYADKDHVLYDEKNAMNFFYKYTDCTIGIRQIYEMIPEFA